MDLRGFRPGTCVTSGVDHSGPLFEYTLQVDRPSHVARHVPRAGVRRVFRGYRTRVGDERSSCSAGTGAAVEEQIQNRDFVHESAPELWVLGIAAVVDPTELHAAIGEVRTAEGYDWAFGPDRYSLPPTWTPRDRRCARTARRSSCNPRSC